MSSLFCLTLWKSYLFNCRTKLAKLLCLKCFGRISLVNFSFCPHVSIRAAIGLPRSELCTSNTTKLSPPSPQRTMLSYDGSSNILHTRFVSHFALFRVLWDRLTCITCAPVNRVSYNARYTTSSPALRRTLTKSLELLAAGPPISPLLSMIGSGRVPSQ